MRPRRWESHVIGRADGHIVPQVRFCNLIAFVSVFTLDEPLGMNEFSDRQIIEQVLEGRTEAFGQLVERYQSAVYGLAYTLV